jgi:Rps23 Pro-64 3,4-dihydroxylase Tpa1-like proline 4-hydroxylase
MTNAESVDPQASLTIGRSFDEGMREGDIPSDVFTEEALSADPHRDAFRSASPWPYIVLEDLINPALIAAAEEQELDPGLKLEVKRSIRLVKAESPEPGGPAARAILDALLTPEFISFLEDVTGIPALQGDPTHYWTGVHVNPPGAFQTIHRDFRIHPLTGLFHRLTVIVYLNSDWKREYGGELELWRSDMSACAQQITPLAGKTVIFATTAEALHGIPDPVRCPPGRARLSLASDYYTVAPAPGDRKEARFLRPKRPQDPWYVRFPTPGGGMDMLRRSLERRSTSRAGG